MTVASEPTLPTLPAGPAKIPKARREQISVEPWETGLVTAARVEFPTVAWWHGYRSIGSYFGSYCYVCSAYIVTFSRRYPIPLVAKAQIHAHKFEHHKGTLPAGTTPNLRGTP